MHKTSHTTLLSIPCTVPEPFCASIPHTIRNAHPGDSAVPQVTMRSQSQLLQRNPNAFTPTLRQTHTQTTSLVLTSLTPGWQESSGSLKWRSTAAGSLKKQLQTKVRFKSKLLSILMMFSHKQSKEEEEEARREKRSSLLWVSTHTASPTTSPGREKPANLVRNKYLQNYFHYKMPHNAQVLCNISTQCYFLCTVQLDI